MTSCECRKEGDYDSTIYRNLISVSKMTMRKLNCTLHCLKYNKTFPDIAIKKIVILT